MSTIDAGQNSLSCAAECISEIEPVQFPFNQFFMDAVLETACLGYDTQQELRLVGPY